MTAKQLANIALRLTGALWTLNAIISLPSLLQLSSAADIQTRKLMLGSGVGELVLLVAGVALFLKSEKLAAFFFPGAEVLSISATRRTCSRLASRCFPCTSGSAQPVESLASSTSLSAASHSRNHA